MTITGAGSGIKSGFGSVDKANARTQHAYGADLSYDSWGKPGTAVGNIYGAGKVASVKEGDTGVGNQVVIDYGGGLQIAYNHMMDFNVKPGQSISAGQNFGRMGATGNAPSGSHISYEFRRNGKVVPANVALPDAKFDKSFWGGREGSWGQAKEFDMKSKQFDVSPGVHSASDGIQSSSDGGVYSTAASGMSTAGGVNLGKLVPGDV
jgi:murein DD-endopeptidase MepM/ murein hydrolase activator NlpD